MNNNFNTMFISKETDQNFSSYGGFFQEKIVQALLVDKKWAQQMHEVLNINFFDKKYLQFITRKYFIYYDKYKTFPSLKLLFSIVRTELKESGEEVLASQIANFFHRMKTKPDINDIQYVKDKSLDFCKKQSLKEALEQSVDMIQTSKYEGIVEVIKKALYVGNSNSFGLELSEDVSRFDEVNRKTIPTGMTQLDHPEILNGGMSNGELAMIFACSGIGKSHFLVQMGANALKLNKNVLHYTLEMSEIKTAHRYDSNLCNIPSNEIVKRKEEVLSFYKENKTGKLIIKEFPSGTATVQTIRNHIERLKLKEFEPDLIIIDYADLLRSSVRSDALRLELDQIYKDLRGLAQELNVPLWTASQANRTSSQANMIALDGLAESYNKGMIVDFAISLSRRPDEKYNNTGRLFIAKNRNGVDGKIFYVNMDTSKSKIEILSEADPANLSSINEVPNVKKEVKKQWEKLMKNNGEEE